MLTSNLQHFFFLEVTASPTTTNFTMAAFIKAVNAKIRSNPTVSYFCSTRTLPMTIPPYPVSEFGASTDES